MKNVKNFNEICENKNTNQQQVEQYATELLDTMYENKKALLAIKEILKFCDKKHKDFLLNVQEKLKEWSK